jgi:hypothetical protein
MSGHNDWPEFEVRESSGQLSRWTRETNRPGDDVLCVSERRRKRPSSEFQRGTHARARSIGTHVVVELRERRQHAFHQLAGRRVVDGLVRPPQPTDFRCALSAKWSYLSRAKRVRLYTMTTWTLPCASGSTSATPGASSDLLSWRSRPLRGIVRGSRSRGAGSNRRTRGAESEDGGSRSVPSC